MKLSALFVAPFLVTTTVLAVTPFSAMAISETKVTGSITGNVDQDKLAIDAVDDNLASNNVSTNIV